MVGVVTSVVVIGWTLQLMNRANRSVQPASYEAILPAPGPDAPREQAPDGSRYAVARAGGVAGIPDGAYLVDDAGRVRYRIQEGIGSEQAPAPQATLMSLVTKGILTQQLPWGFVLLGVCTSLLMEIIGVPALAFAVGMYLPLEITTPVYAGGLVRRIVDVRRGSDAESDAGPGVLYSSGLVAGGSIIGLLSSLLGLPWFEKLGERLAFAPNALPELAAFLLFCGVAVLIYRAATRAAPAA